MVSAWCRCVCCWRTAGVLPLLVGIGDMGDNRGCGNAAVVVVVVVVAATQRRWLCAEATASMSVFEAVGSGT